MKKFLTATIALVVAAPLCAQTTIEGFLIQPFAAPLFSESDVRKIRRGDVVKAPITKTSERQLAAAVACLLRADHDVVLRDFLEVIPVTVGSDVLAHGEIDTDDIRRSFSELSLGDGEVEELQRVIEFDGGFGLNLSAGEIAAFDASRQSSPDQRIADAREILVDILVGRTTAYMESGFDAVAPYRREGATDNDIAAEIRENAEVFPKQISQFSGFRNAWVGMPLSPSVDPDDAYYWLTLDIDKRPVIALSHRLYVKNGEFEAIGIRDFYFTSFFDAGQSVAALLPVPEGILLVTAAHFWVDFWSGSAKMKHSMGTKMLAKQMRHLVEDKGICGNR
jgi:hypothetical protein